MFSKAYFDAIQFPTKSLSTLRKLVVAFEPLWDMRQLAINVAPSKVNSNVSRFVNLKMKIPKENQTNLFQ
jgi:L-cystine uptake protein TcyP (sodium:dicarboxylate symporter family)